MEDFVKLGGGYPEDGCALVNHTLVKHIHCHLERCKSGSLTDTALEHIELAILDGELDVLHIVEVVLKKYANVVELLVNLRHCLLQGLEVLVMVCLGGLVQRVRCADTCNYILALGVDEPLSVELVVTDGRVAGESNSGSGGVAHISEYH